MSMEPRYPIGVSSFPATLETPLPRHFDRVQLLVRLLVLVVIGFFHQTLGGIFALLYVLLPLIAAVQIGRKKGARFLTEDAPWLLRVLDWVVAVYAYLLFVNDRFPLESRIGTSHLVVRPRGSPTVGTALLRLLTTIPHAFVLAVLGIGAGLIGFVATLSVLVTESYPAALQSFQRGVATWMARVLTYHASLVEEYPPFSLRTQEERMPPADRRPPVPMV